MTVFAWFLLLVGIYIICLDWIPKMKQDHNKAMTIVVSFFCFVVATLFLVSYPVKKEARREYYSVPIITQLSSLEGRTFTPQAFVVTERRIVVYDHDNRVYALDGIKLEKGLASENLTVGTNISYIVYRRGDHLEFGRL